MSAFELTLRVLGLVELMLVASILLCSRRRDHTARVAAALCFSVAAFMLTSMPGAMRVFGWLVYPLTAICGTHPVWFWLFCVTLFGDRRQLAHGDWLALAFMAVFGVLDQAIFGTAWAASHTAWSQALGITYGAAALAFACLAPLAVFAGGRLDLDERRRRVRTWFVPLVSAYLAIVVITQVYVTLVGRQTPLVLVVANLALVDALATVALWSFLRVRVVSWLDLAEPAPNVEALSRPERKVLERLTARLVPERLYARDGLTIAALAALLDTQEHVLRRVINGALGFRNFNDFLHSYRLREAAARLRDPAERRIPILTIALEAGYGSIGPFNRAFKERFGMTPTEYRRTPAQLSIVADLGRGGNPALAARAQDWR